MAGHYDAVIVISFGGPEGPDDVMPFLENVLRGKNVPHERMVEVSHHYDQFGGVSPLNAQNREIIRALEAELASNGIELPVYFGNRNWHPMLTDTLRQMAADGVTRALGFVTSAYSSYSGCRQYREDMARARDEVGSGAPAIDKIRLFYNHPLFVQANAENVKEALSKVPEGEQSAAHVLFTAHSIPVSMADTCSYVRHLEETARLVSEALGLAQGRIVYQSRSGPPSQPWLEPDVCDVLPELKEDGARHVILAPFGFVSDHLEVLYDLDTEAQEVCDELGLHMERAATAGTHPAFAVMVRELIAERLDDAVERRALGEYGPWPDTCGGEACCVPPKRGGPPR